MVQYRTFQLRSVLVLPTVSVPTRTPVPGSPLDSLRRLFCALDMNSDGTVSRGEFRFAVRDLELSNDEFDRIFRVFDPDLTGRMTLDELFFVLGSKTVRSGGYPSRDLFLAAVRGLREPGAIDVAESGLLARPGAAAS